MSSMVVHIDDIMLFPKECDNHIVYRYIMNPIICLPKRILLSLVPPLFYIKATMFVDFIGPLLGILLLILVLKYGTTCKIGQFGNTSLVTITAHVLIYFFGMSLFIFVTPKLVQTKIRFLEATTLIGYSFYGCALTLLVPFLIDSLSDNLFVISLIILGGLCGLRVIGVLLYAIKVPVARLLICSFYGSVHNIFLIYAYYSYMHSTFVFQKRKY